MKKSTLEAEALLYWGICRDLKRPGLTEIEAREFSNEMEGFAMNVENKRLRAIAASSLSALAASLQYEQEENAGLPSVELTSVDGNVAVFDRGNGWEEVRITGPREITKAVMQGYLDLQKARLSAAERKS